VLLGEREIVVVPQYVLYEDSYREGQAGDVLTLFLQFGERVVLEGTSGSVQLANYTEEVVTHGRYTLKMYERRFLCVGAKAEGCHGGAEQRKEGCSDREQWYVFIGGEMCPLACQFRNLRKFAEA
jgi:hypothetical protein